MDMVAPELPGQRLEPAGPEEPAAVWAMEASPLIISADLSAPAR